MAPPAPLPQIAAAILASALLEVAITMVRTRQIVWPASAMLTGSGVGLILRVNGTGPDEHWSVHHWWLFALVAAASLATKYVIHWHGSHLFNPSNIGLVAVFVLPGSDHVEPLEFWWHGFGPAMVLAYAVIVFGGLAINARLGLLVLSGSFWLIFAAGTGAIAKQGHCVVAPWSATPVCGGRFWWTIVTSPEVFVFLLFMITDPKTVPSGRLSRIASGISVAVVATLLIAPQRTEFGAKVGLLGALTLVCAARPLVDLVARLPRPSFSPDALGIAAGGALVCAIAVYVIALSALGSGARTALAAPIVAEVLPDRATILQQPPSLPLPDITFDPSMSVFGDSYRSSATYPPIVSGVVYAFAVESEVLRLRDPELLRAVDHGERLRELEKLIAGAMNRALPATTYSFDTMHFAPVRSGGQGGSVIGIAAEGTGRTFVYEINGRTRAVKTQRVRLSIAIRQAGDRRWLLVDVAVAD